MLCRIAVPILGKKNEITSGEGISGIAIEEFIVRSEEAPASSASSSDKALTGRNSSGQT